MHRRISFLVSFAAFAILAACGKPAPQQDDFLSGFDAVWQLASGSPLISPLGIIWHYDRQRKTVEATDLFGNEFIEVRPNTYDQQNKQITATISHTRLGRRPEGEPRFLQEEAIIRNAAPDDEHYQLQILIPSLPLATYSFLRRLTAADVNKLRDLDINGRPVDADDRLEPPE